MILSINTELVEKSYIRSTPFHHQPASMDPDTLINIQNMFEYLFDDMVRTGITITLVEKPRIEAVVDSDVADDEFCAICLREKKDDPSLPWVIAVGCSRHKYHPECVKPWRGFHCMTCRAPITQRW